MGQNDVTVGLFPPQPSGSEGQTSNENEERERLRRVLKQMGRIKCPSEVCTSFVILFSFLVSYVFVTSVHFCFLQIFPLASHILPAIFNLAAPFSLNCIALFALLTPERPKERRS